MSQKLFPYWKHPYSQAIKDLRCFQIMTRKSSYTMTIEVMKIFTLFGTIITIISFL